MRSACVLGLLAMLSVVTVAAAASPPAPRNCSPSASPRVIHDTPRPEAICGSRFADRIYISGRDVVFAYAGNDTIYARNGRLDEIWGGRGRDRAYVDSCDNVNGVERVTRGRKQCRRLNP